MYGSLCFSVLCLSRQVSCLMRGQCSSLSLRDGGMWRCFDPSPAIQSFLCFFLQATWFSVPHPRIRVLPSSVLSTSLKASISPRWSPGNRLFTGWQRQGRPLHPALGLGTLGVGGMGYCHGTGLTSKFSHMGIISMGAGRSLAASSTFLLHF